MSECVVDGTPCKFIFDPVFSYENGAGEIYICVKCGRRWVEQDEDCDD